MSIEKVGQSLARTILVNLFIMIFASLVSCGNGGSPNQAPVFTSAEELSVIEQSTATGYFPTAFDADGDALSFSIRGGSDESHFELDPTTGELKFVSAPYFDTPTDVGENNFYKVKLRVSDGSVSSELTLRVKVAPKPNQAPVFTSAEELSVIEQSTATGYFPTAFDADGDALSFSIRGGSDESHFELDPTTGELKFVSAPYFDTPTDVGENNTYQVKLRVSDGSVSSALTLRVNVAPKPKPNIIFIAIDDLNDWVEGFDGHPDTITPNIAELASRGVMFSNAHAPSVLCNPSRASVLTGLAPQHTGVLKNKQVPIRDYIGYDIETVFQYFQRNDYYVAGTGKLFHQGGDDETEPWSEYQRLGSRRGKPSDTPYHGLDELSVNWGPGDDEDYIWNDYRKANYAEQFLNRTHVKPFFLALGFSLPHVPWFVPHEN